ncbi:MAG: hypothetical protein WEE64_06920 [Dehalococcoidia bacterium]
MATITIGYQPELTKERAREIFAVHFAGACDVYPTAILNRDFIVKKSDWSGVGVRLKQEQDATTFVFTAMIPNPILQGLFGGLLSALFLRKSWKAMEAEVAEFIEASPSFPEPSAQNVAAA